MVSILYLWARCWSLSPSWHVEEDTQRFVDTLTEENTEMEEGECLSQGHGWKGVFLVPKHVFHEEFFN